MRDDGARKTWTAFAVILAVVGAFFFTIPGLKAIFTLHFHGQVGGGMVGENVDLRGWPALSQGMLLILLGLGVPIAVYYVGAVLGGDDD